jgi:hypothetical protein
MPLKAFGDVSVTLRPIKFAFLVNPAERNVLDRVIQASLFQWGGLHNPIVPIYGRLPRYWSDLPTRRKPPAEICKGYLRMFDPDAVIVCGTVDKSVIPNHIQHIHTFDEFVGDLSKEDAPTFGIGLFELLANFAEEEFKYTRRDGMKILVPTYEAKESTLFKSVLGDIPAGAKRETYRELIKKIDIDQPHVTIDNFLQVIRMQHRLLSSICAHRLEFRRPSIERSLAVFLLDHGKPRGNVLGSHAFLVVQLGERLELVGGMHGRPDDVFRETDLVGVVGGIEHAPHRLGLLDLLALGAKEMGLSAALADGDEVMAGLLTLPVILWLDHQILEQALGGNAGGQRLDKDFQPVIEIARVFIAKLGRQFEVGAQEGSVLQFPDDPVGDVLINVLSHFPPPCLLVAAAAATLPVGETGGSKGKEAPNAERRGSARGTLSLTRPMAHGLQSTDCRVSDRDTGGCGVPCLDALPARGAAPLSITKTKNGGWAGAQRRPFASPGTG